MGNIILSVVVPVYNGEKFLRRVIESVVCQMNGQIELILVNDGSTDNSAKICDEYAEKNAYIRAIHQENGGTSSAKNRGIGVARGKYISFMDCDDFIDSDTYEQCIPLLVKYQPDCLDFGLKYIGQSGEVGENINQIEKNKLLSRNVIEKDILPPLLNLCKDDAHFIFDFAVNKLFKAEIIKKNGIKFDEDKRTWEDRTFLLRHLKYCKNFYSMDRCFYNYVYTPNSLSQRYTIDYFRIIIQNFNHYRELYEELYDFDTQYVCDYWSNSIENMIFRSLQETENVQEIEDAITQALNNSQVIHWFKKRNSNNLFQKKVSSNVVEGRYKHALDLYKKEFIKRQKRQKCTRLINNVKYRLKSIFKC